MPGQMNHKLESRLLVEISITSNIQVTNMPSTLMAENKEELGLPWWLSDKESWEPKLLSPCATTTEANAL